MKLKVVLDDGAVMPTKAHDSDAGFDLYSKEDKLIPARHNRFNIKEENSATFDIGGTANSRPIMLGGGIFIFREDFCYETHRHQRSFFR